MECAWLLSIIGSGMWALFPLNFDAECPGHSGFYLGYSDLGATKLLFGYFDSIKLIVDILLFKILINIFK